MITRYILGILLTVIGHEILRECNGFGSVQSPSITRVVNLWWELLCVVIACFPLLLHACVSRQCKTRLFGLGVFNGVSTYHIAPVKTTTTNKQNDWQGHVNKFVLFSYYTRSLYVVSNWKSESFLFISVLQCPLQLREDAVSIPDCVTQKTYKNNTCKLHCLARGK